MGLMEFIFMIMMEEENHNDNEMMMSSSLLLLKIGVVLALSFGFLFTRLRNKRIHRVPSLPSQSLPSHSGGNKIDYLNGSFDHENNYVHALHEANEGLRKENFQLAKEIDRLEANQCAFYEEQVYLKWVNACLRYEVRNYKPPSGKTMARDLNINMSPKSQEKAKQLLLEYTNSDEDSNKNHVKSLDFESRYWSSSQTTTPDATDSVSFKDGIINVSSAMKPKRWNKVKILSRVKRLLVLQKTHYSSSSLNSYNAAGDKRTQVS